MTLINKIKKQENLHIVFWLIKDSCWMLEIKWLGILMVGPALFVALRISYLARATSDVFINLAIFFWIMANSYWMITEFYFDNLHKNLAGIPFLLGFFFVAVFYLGNNKNLAESS